LIARSPPILTSNYAPGCRDDSAAGLAKTQAADVMASLVAEGVGTCLTRAKRGVGSSVSASEGRLSGRPSLLRECT
jgi:hypothetical protein